MKLSCLHLAVCRNDKQETGPPYLCFFLLFFPPAVNLEIFESVSQCNICLLISYYCFVQVVSKEAIIYGMEDNKSKVCLIDWVLPYAQRYIFKSYPAVYLNMKQLGFNKLSQLQIVVVEKLYYKHTLRGHESSSRKRFECSCLLQVCNWSISELTWLLLFLQLVVGSIFLIYHESFCQVLNRTAYDLDVPY